MAEITDQDINQCLQDLVRRSYSKGGSPRLFDDREALQTILERAGNHCEGSPAYPDCRAANGLPHPVTQAKVVLTTAHLDHDPTNNNQANLRAWCQRCHNTYDARARAAGIKARKAASAAEDH